MSLPDLSSVHYTLVITHEELCELIAGRVPHDVLVMCLSGMIAMSEEPAEFVAKPKRRKKAA